MENVRTAYNIGHIVSVDDGLIRIGSGYVIDLLNINKDGEVAWGGLGSSSIDTLRRYYDALTADREKLRALIEAPDTFERSIPVYVFLGNDLVEKQCETPDWPNVTHDGMVMYNNMFSTDRNRVIEWKKEELSSTIGFLNKQVEKKKQELEDLAKEIGSMAETLKKIESGAYAKA